MNNRGENVVNNDKKTVLDREVFVEQKENITGVDEKKDATQHRRLTAKEKAYISAIAEGKTRRQAIRDSYDVKPDVSVKTLDNMASMVEQRPAVLALLHENEREAQEAVLDVMRYSQQIGRTGTKEGAQYARVALDGANSLLDRVHGKAKQQIEMQSTTVSIAIDLSASQDDDVIDV